MIFAFFDVVTLVEDIPKEGLHVGVAGAVVDVYTVPSLAYEVEFCDASGKTLAQLALLPAQLRLVVGNYA